MESLIVKKQESLSSTEYLKKFEEQVQSKGLASYTVCEKDVTELTQCAEMIVFGESAVENEVNILCSRIANRNLVLKQNLETADTIYALKSMSVSKIRDKQDEGEKYIKKEIVNDTKIFGMKEEEHKQLLTSFSSISSSY